jgi:hypothetical protein
MHHWVYMGVSLSQLIEKKPKPRDAPGIHLRADETQLIGNLSETKAEIDLIEQ